MFLFLEQCQGGNINNQIANFMKLLIKGTLNLMDDFYHFLYLHQILTALNYYGMYLL